MSDFNWGATIAQLQRASTPAEAPVRFNPRPPRRLVEDSDIHDAILWRLAGWTPEAINAGTVRLASLMARGVPMDSAEPDVAAVLATLRRPGDRRDPWSGACALLALHGEAHGDVGLYFRAGFEVCQSRRQAQRGHQRPAGDALDELLAQYLRRHPKTPARALFTHCASLELTSSMLVDSASAANLTYWPSVDSNRLRTVKRHAFEVRVSRAKKKLEAEACCREQTPRRIFSPPNQKPSPQPVAVKWPA